MLVVGDDALEFLQQVEGDVRLPAADFLAQLGQVVVQAQCAHLVPGLAQKSHHVIFGFPFLDLLGRVAREGSGRHEALVHEYQHAEFLHPATPDKKRSGTP